MNTHAHNAIPYLLSVLLVDVRARVDHRSVIYICILRVCSAYPSLLAFHAKEISLRLIHYALTYRQPFLYTLLQMLLCLRLLSQQLRSRPNWRLLQQIILDQEQHP